MANVIINDLSAARFDVRVNISKSFSTSAWKRARHARFHQDVAGRCPFVIDLLAKNMDWPSSPADRQTPSPDGAAASARRPEQPAAAASMDDPTVAVEVGLKQAQTERRSPKLRKSAAMRVCRSIQTSPETPDEERLLKAHTGRIDCGAGLKVHAEIQHIGHKAALESNRHETDTALKSRQRTQQTSNAADTHFKGRQQRWPKSPPHTKRAEAQRPMVPAYPLKAPGNRPCPKLPPLRAIRAQRSR